MGDLTDAIVKGLGPTLGIIIAVLVMTRRSKEDRDDHRAEREASEKRQLDASKEQQAGFERSLEKVVDHDAKRAATLFEKIDESTTATRELTTEIRLRNEQSR